MNPLLTDDAVARLPVDGGRAALLAEIVGTPAGADDPATRAVVLVGSRRRWVGPAAAAVTVAALVVGGAWVGNGWHADSAPRPPAASPSADANRSPSASTDAQRVVLDAGDWHLDFASTGGSARTEEIGWSRGDATLRIDGYPASGYEQRYDSRTHVTDPPSDGTEVSVLGLTGHLWAHSAEDHTVLLPARAGRFLEIRGTGLDQDALLELLGRLRFVDDAAFDASLPGDFVRSSERDPAVSTLLDGIAQHARPLLPPTLSRSDITSEESDPVQVGSDVANEVTCAWLATYADARRRGDDLTAQEAVDVMSTSRRWPVLQELRDRSDVPEWVWAVSDEMAAGQVPAGWQPSCQGHQP